jgi:hypothetical protein
MMGLHTCQYRQVALKKGGEWQSEKYQGYPTASVQGPGNLYKVFNARGLIYKE